MNLLHPLSLVVILSLLLIASNLWFYLRVLCPVRRLARQAKHLADGDLEALGESCGGIKEVIALGRAMAGMVGHVRRAQEHHRAYADQLTSGQETERKRIARDLHDGTVQSLIAINQSIDLARNWINTDPQKAEAMLQTAREQAVTTVTELRNLIGGLRPPALEELGLIAALKMLADGISNPPVKIAVEGTRRRLPESHELALFRIAQEALNNIQRHSHASRASVTVEYTADHVTMHIADNGRGFIQPEHVRDFMRSKHYGLAGIQERLHALNGTLTIKSQMGAGTTITAHLPTEDIAQPDQRVRDPVCNALIEPQQAFGSTEYAGTTYYFCCPVCQGAFQKDPALYLKPPSPDLG